MYRPYDKITNDIEQNRIENDIYFNLSIYIQLIVANKTYTYTE